MARRKKSHDHSKQLRFVIRDPIYKTDILLFLGGTKAQAIERFRKALIKTGIDAPPFEDISEATASMITFGSFRGFALWFCFHDPDAGTVAHEAFHGTAHVMRTLPVDLTDESEEAYAYYLDWLVREVGKRVWP